MSDVRVDEADYYERPLPSVGNGALVAALLLTLIAVGGWEHAMRGKGLVPWDLADGPDHWVAERRKIDDGDVEVAIIGASRILFDTDLDVFEDVTGLRPVQLALAGTNARPFLTDLAADDDFKGLLIVGVTEIVYFMPPELGLFVAALEHYRQQTPAERFGHALYVRLQQLLAFIDPDYTLPRLLYRLQLPRRAGTFDPYDEVWKIATSEPDRQTRMWYRIESPGYLVDHAKHAWVADWEAFKSDYLGGVAPDRLAQTIAETRRDVEKIRARGGDVVFVRCPSSDFYRQVEREFYPRSKVFDRLVAETGVLGLHFEDYETMRGLTLPEWSHLSADAARTFTRAYAEELLHQSQWLRAHSPKRER